MVRPKFKDEHVFGQSLALLVPAPIPLCEGHEPAPPTCADPPCCGQSRRLLGARAKEPDGLTLLLHTEKRKAEAERIRAKYSDRIPVSSPSTL